MNLKNPSPRTARFLRAFHNPQAKPLRAVAATLICILLAQDLAMAAGTDLWNHTAIPAPAFLALTGGSGSSADNPGARATLRRRYKGSDLIINIQDSHESLTAQQSISKLLDGLTSSYQLELVGLEGSEGPVDTSLVADFPDERVRDNIAQELVGKTMISAAEYRQIVQGGQVELYGVERAPLYRRNVRDYQLLLSARPKALAEMARLKSRVDHWSLGRVPESILVIHKLCTDHAEGRIQFAEYWERMSAAAEQASVDTAEFPMLKLLVEAIGLEKKIDFDRATAERETLITDLKAHLSRSDRARMLKWLVLFRMGKMSGAQVHRMLLERAASVLTGEQFPELTQYSNYLALYEKIDLGELFTEMRGFERRVIERLLPDADADRAFNFIEMLGLLDRLLKGEMTPFDHRRYGELTGGAGLDAMRQTFGSERVGEAIAVDWVFLKKADHIARGFYRRVQARNRAMIERLTARMREKGVHTAALVTGGFHAEGLSEIMEEDRISHMVVLPEFDPNGPKRPYATVITSKSAYLDAAAREAALAEVIALAVWSAAVQGITVPRAQAILERNAAKLASKGTSGARSNRAAGRTGALSALPALGSKSAAPIGRVADGWLGTASVLGNLDAQLAGRMIRDLTVDKDRIRVGQYLFRGSTRTETTPAGVVRRHGMVRRVLPKSRMRRPESGMAEYLKAIRSTGKELIANPGPIRTTGRLSDGFDRLLEMRLRRQGLDPAAIRIDLKDTVVRARDRAVALVQAAARMAEPAKDTVISVLITPKSEPKQPITKLSPPALKYAADLPVTQLYLSTGCQWPASNVSSAFKADFIRELIQSVRAFKSNNLWKGEVFWPDIWSEQPGDEEWSFKDAMLSNGYFDSPEFERFALSFLVQVDPFGEPHPVTREDVIGRGVSEFRQVVTNFRESTLNIVEQYSYQQFKVDGVTPEFVQIAKTFGVRKTLLSVWSWVVEGLRELSTAIAMKLFWFFALIRLAAIHSGVLKWLEENKTVTFVMEELFRLAAPEEDEKISPALLGVAIGGITYLVFGTKLLEKYADHLKERLNESLKGFHQESLRAAILNLDEKRMHSRVQQVDEWQLRLISDLEKKNTDTGVSLRDRKLIDEVRALMASVRVDEDWFGRSMRAAEWISDPANPFQADAKGVALAVLAEIEDANPGFLAARIRGIRDGEIRSIFLRVEHLAEIQSTERFNRMAAEKIAWEEADEMSLSDDAKRKHAEERFPQILGELSNNANSHHADFYDKLIGDLKILGPRLDRYQVIVSLFARVRIRVQDEVERSGDLPARPEVRQALGRAVSGLMSLIEEDEAKKNSIFKENTHTIIAFLHEELSRMSQDLGIHSGQAPGARMAVTDKKLNFSTPSDQRKAVVRTAIKRRDGDRSFRPSYIHYASAARMSVAKPEEGPTVSGEWIRRILGILILIVPAAEYYLHRTFGDRRGPAAVVETHLPRGPDNLRPEALRIPSFTTSPEPNVLEMVRRLKGIYPSLQEALDRAEKELALTRLRRHQVDQARADLAAQKITAKENRQKSEIDLEEAMTYEPRRLKALIAQKQAAVTAFRALQNEMGKFVQEAPGLLARRQSAPESETVNTTNSIQDLEVKIREFEGELGKRRNQADRGTLSRVLDGVSVSSTGPGLSLGKFFTADRDKKADQLALEQTLVQLESARASLNTLQRYRISVGDGVKAKERMDAQKITTDLNREMSNLKVLELQADGERSLYEDQLQKTGPMTQKSQIAVAAAVEKLTALEKRDALYDTEIKLLGEVDQRTVNDLGKEVFASSGLIGAQAAIHLKKMSAMLDQLKSGSGAEALLMAEALYLGLPSLLGSDQGLSHVRKTPYQDPALYRLTAAVLDGWVTMIGNAARRSFHAWLPDERKQPRRNWRCAKFRARHPAPCTGAITIHLATAKCRISRMIVTFTSPGNATSSSMRRAMSRASLGSSVSGISLLLTMTRNSRPAWMA